MITNSKIKRAKKIKSIRQKYGRKATCELLICKSNQHISAYLVDLDSYNSLFSVSSMGKENDAKKMSKLEKSTYVGIGVAKMCREKNMRPVINVAQYKYHGNRVKALVDAFFENLTDK